MARSGFRKIPTSMRGVQVDMDALRTINEQSPAIGNGRMNARGDIVGNNGKIEITREQIAREYYRSNPQGAKAVSLKPAIPDTFETPNQAVARLTTPAVTTSETDAPQGLAPRKGRKLVDKGDE